MSQIKKQLEENQITPSEAVEQLDTQSSFSLSSLARGKVKRPLYTGFEAIDSVPYIYANVGNVVTIAARPGSGKTALATQIGLNVSRRGKVLFFSLEMSKESIFERLLSNVTNKSIKELHDFKVTNEFDSFRFHIIDEYNLTPNDIVFRSFAENKLGKVDLVVIDYIGLLSYSQWRHEDIKKAMYLFKKDLAEVLNIPVIVLAQMNRGFEERCMQAKFAYDKSLQYKGAEPNPDILNVRPMMEDLGESAGIEHASDVVMFLQRPYLHNPMEPPSKFKVFVAKNRNGPVKDFELLFNDKLTKFYNKVD